MPTGIDTAALDAAFTSYMDNVEGWITTRLIEADLPLLGDGLVGHAATLTAFIADYRTRFADAVALMDPVTDTAAEVIAAFGAQGIGAVEIGGSVQITLTYEDLTAALPGIAMAENLGLSLPGFGLGGAADLAAQITSEFVFDIDLNSGALTRSGNQTEAFSLTLTGDLALDADASLGVLDVSVTNTNIEPDISLQVDMTAWEGGGAKLTASGAMTLAAHLRTTTDAAILPTLDADFNAGFSIGAQTLTEGVGLAVEAQFAIDNVTLDLAGFSDFLGAVFGELDRLLGTYPLGALIDIVTAELPVIPDILPGLEDEDDSDDVITIVDLLNSINAGINTDFLDEIIYLVNLIQAVSDLADDGVLNLGGVDLSAEASTVLMLGGSLDGLPLLDTDIRAGWPEPQGWLDFLDILQDGQGLDLPFLSEPLTNLVHLLLNGLGAPTVDLVEYDLPQFEFLKGIDIPFYFGPVKFFIGGEFGATVDMSVGYDSAGFDPAGIDFSQGFYLGTDQGPDGQPNPFATVQMTLEAGGGVDVFVASATVSGGITGTLGMNLVGSDDGKTYLYELASFPCIFDDITGTVSAGLNIELTLGKKPFAITERLNLAEVVLAQFNIDPCSVDPSDMRAYDTGLARSVLAGDLLRLHVGADGWRRDLPDAVDNNGGVLNTDTFDIAQGRDGLEQADEIMVVTRAPLEDEDGFQPETDALAVQAFGLYDVIDSEGAFSEVYADAGIGDDYIALGETLTLMADLGGGEGKDTLIGARGDDELRGNEGRDQLYGNDGDDTLRGGWGNDLLVGGWGADLLDGGAGDVDEVDYSNATSGVILTALVSGGALIEFVASSNGAVNEAEGDTLRSVEYIKGSEFDDVLSGDPFDAMILQGRGGDDYLEGGGDGDLLNGGTGADTLIGNGGEDTASYVLSEAGVWIDLDSGLAFGGEAQGDTLTDIDSLDLTYHDDYAAGDSGANRIDGFSGDDLIDGRGGLDTLLGGGGQDTIHAQANGATLNGGGVILQGENVGENEISRDLLTFEDSDHTGGIDASLKRGSAVQRSGALTFDTIAFATLLDADLNEITQTDFSTFEDLTGSGFADILEGDLGGNVLRGRNGADELLGNGGNDTLIGGNGADTLNGGSGIDWVDYSGASEGVTVFLNGTAGTGGTAQDDIISLVENITGTAFGDNLNGNANANIFDPLFTGAQGDTIDGGLLTDTLRLRWDYEEDDVSIYRRSGGDIEVSIGLVDSFLEIDATSVEQIDVTLQHGNDLISSVSDGVDFGSGDDFASTGEGSDTIELGGGRDIVYAGDDADRVFRTIDDGPKTFLLDGGDGFDQLSINLAYATEDLELRGKAFGDGAMDTLFVEGGGVVQNFEYLGDVITGSGDDTIQMLGRSDGNIETGTGADLVLLESGDHAVFGGDDTDVDRLVVDASRLDGRLVSDFYPTGKNGFDGAVFFYETLLTIETLTGTTDYVDIDRIQLIGGSGDDFLRGISGNGGTTGEGDLLQGGDGNDTLEGFAQRDTLEGGAGADSLDGGGWQDVLVGGVMGQLDGIDTVTGGGGADLFVLGTQDGSHYGEGADDWAIITDLDSSVDTLQLHGTEADYWVQYTLATQTIINAVGSNERVARVDGLLFDLDAAFISYVDAPATPQAPEAGGLALSPPAHVTSQGDPDHIAINALSLDRFQIMIHPMFEVLFGGGTAPTNERLSAEGDVVMLDGEPFGMGIAEQNRGFALSTGDIEHADGVNVEDGADTPEPTDGLPQDLNFERIGVTEGGSVVFRALLPASAGAINSLTIADSNNFAGAGGVYTGFDLDGILLSRTRVEAVDEATEDLDLSGLSALDVFDYSPAGTFLDAGDQSARVNPIFVPSAQNLAGTFNGYVDEAFARLGSVDYDGNPLNGGAFSLGDGGSISFELTESVDTTTPLYLYVAEAADNGERPDASVSASSGTLVGAGDWSADQGTPGAQDDQSRLRYSFDLDIDDSYGGAVWKDLFQLVIITEELPENRLGVDLDQFDVRINGVSAAFHTDGRQASFESLMLDQTGALSHDVILNLAGDGALSDIMKADAYTQILTVSGPVLDGANVFDFLVADGGDGFLDTGMFLVPFAGALIEGTSDNDSLVGDAMSDRIEGLAGEDTLEGLAGNDTLDGGAGDDSLVGGAGADDLRGGDGDDTVSYIDSATGVGASLDDVAQNTGDAAGDQFDGIENLSGSDHNDTLEGDAGANALTGLFGDDLMIGLNGADTIYSDDGDDTVLGGNGADLINTGEGADSVDGGGGRDTVFLDEGNDIFVDTTQVSFGEDTVFGGSGADTIIGGGGDDSFSAGTGYDIVSGGEGNDTISGSGGYDDLSGEDGDDAIDGGDGRDTIAGGAGDDLITEESQTGWVAADSIHGNGGADTIYGGGGNDSIWGDWGADLIFGEAENDLIYGGDQNDTIDGGAGNDTVYGGNGADDVSLGSGHDVWEDNAQATGDSVDGGDGNDTIEAQGGNDTLTGGTGADVFVLRLGMAFDQITDFEVGIDTLQIEGALWNGPLTQAHLDSLDTPETLVSLQFGNGDEVRLDGLFSTAGLLSDIVLI